MNFANGWASTITTGPGPSDTSVTPSNTTGCPAAPFAARLRNNTQTSDNLHFTLEEIVIVTQVSGGVFTITRAAEPIYDGTQDAQDFSATYIVIEHVISAGALSTLAPAAALVYAYTQFR